MLFNIFRSELLVHLHLERIALILGGYGAQRIFFCNLVLDLDDVPLRRGEICGKSEEQVLGHPLLDPKACWVGAVIEADRLLEKLMSQRGFTVGDYEQQTSDLSVHHPSVVQNYRAAHVLAEQERRGQATTADLREAIIQYRALYEELLGRRVSNSNEVIL